jgi:hypothetical protein
MIDRPIPLTIKDKHNRLVLICIALLAIATGMAFQGCPDKKRDGRVTAVPAKDGEVSGSVFYMAPVMKTPGNVTPAPILLPDIEVFLHNEGTGVDTPPIKTDLYGRYRFPTQKPGTYVLRWKAQRGWAAGQLKNPININGPRFPLPAQIVPSEGSGVIFGRVTLDDGRTPWSYDELFKVDHTANVTILNTTRTTTLGGPIRANSEGRYAVAGLPRATATTIRAQSQAALINRAVDPARVSVGNGVVPTDVQLPNKPPEMISVTPRIGGVRVQTAAPGDTVTLVAGTRDLNSDPLQFEWIAMNGHGSVAPTVTGSANWLLPATPGRYTAYVQANDGRGGFARQRIDFVTAKTEETFAGVVFDKETNLPLKDATVVVNGKTTTSNNDGFFSVRAPLGDRYVLTISRAGYATFSRVVDTGLTGQRWPLVQAHSELVDPKGSIVLVDKRPYLERKKLRGTRIHIDPDSLVSPTGTPPPPGMLTAFIATLDISDGEAPGDWGAMSGGTDTNLISFGATFVEFRDAAGVKYNLAPGKEATVEAFPPFSMAAAAPPSAKFWSYDEADGFWKESGVSTFSAADGFFRGRVRHFSTINTDIEKNDDSCLKILIYPPIPTGVKLRVTSAAFAQAYEGVLNAGINAVFRLPNNTDVQLALKNSDNSPYAGAVLLEEVPGVPLPSNTVNTGPPLGPGVSSFPPEPYEPCKLVILREANEPTANSFLGFKGAGTAALAQGYYDAVDPDDKRLTLGAWWAENGFTFDGSGNPTNGVRTSYLNNNDLGSGRDMHFLQHPDGRAAAYVTNYGLFNQDHGNADLAASRTNPGATVCMEFGPVEGAGATRIVKFFVYAGAGGGANAPRQPSANLDGFGEKFVPNLCLNCHGGGYAPATPAAPSFAEINMGASFRELDYATYKFPAGRIVPNAGEKAAFKLQNLIVKGLAPGDTIAIQPIKDVIAGWYAGGTDDQDNNFTPPGWVGAPKQALYHDVVKPSCRTCHVALDADPFVTGEGWITYDQLEARRPFLLPNFALCESRIMPHAVITYRNFWLSASPHRPAVLRTFQNGAAWTQIGPCP